MMFKFQNNLLSIQTAKAPKVSRKNMIHIQDTARTFQRLMLIIIARTGDLFSEIHTLESSTIQESNLKGNLVMLSYTYSKTFIDWKLHAKCPSCGRDFALGNSSGYGDMREGT